MKEIKKFFIGLLASVIFVNAFISCRVGLGAEVDIIPPEIVVTTPEVLSAVNQSFTVSGAATDNVGISAITVRILETEQEYKYNGTKWQYKTGEEWEDYSSGTVEGSVTSLKWSVTICISKVLDTEYYTLECQAYDEFGNNGKKSKDERYVSLDIQPPTVSIISPDVKNYETSIKNFEEYTLKDNNVLSYLLNQSISVSGDQKENSKLESLYVYIDEGKEEALLPYGIESDISKLLVNCVYKKEMIGSNFHNWSFTIAQSDLPSSLNTGKHLLRLITESSDTAGNIERKVQGWFIYWNEADTPWIDARFGDTTFISGDEQTKVYPSCNLQGQSYDDDGLAEVIIKVITYDSENNIWDEENANITIEDLTLKDFPKYYAWSARAISENKIFKVVVDCKDKYGKSAEQVVRYLGISDVTPPTLTITSPENGATVIGDSTGKFTISGTITDDGDNVTLKMVRICNRERTNILDYFNSENVGWTADKNGNKIFDIELQPTGYAGGYYSWTFSKDFNIFEDFGISQTELINTQYFIFKSSDSSGAASIDSLSLQGDTEAPVLKIKKLEVFNKDGSLLGEYALDSDTIPTIDPYNRTIDKVTDKIRISGEWSDNTYTVWNDINKIGKIKLNVFGTDYYLDPQATKTWETELITPDSSATSANISAQIVDFGGNKTKSTASYFVNTANPELVRITSDMDDKAYNSGTINIILEYNKKVTLSGPGAKLTLNNGGEATYTAGSGTSKHIYTYTVGNNDVKVLDVTSIKPNGSTWEDDDHAPILVPSALPGDGAKLKDLKSIEIDRTAPTLIDIGALSISGAYKAGKEIFISATFSEDVEFSDPSLITLTFNNEKSTSSTSKNSSTNLLFKYKIESDETHSHDTSALRITSFNLNGCTIKDKANNSLASIEINDTNNLSTAGIKIDTTVPETPVAVVKVDDVAIDTGKIVYADEGFKIEFLDMESASDTVKKYSVDNGSSWIDYKTPVTITTNGSYDILAYQEDSAGNHSDTSALFTVSLDKGNLLNSISSFKTDGSYASGDIDIELNFRKPVTIEDTDKIALKLNTNPVRYALYSSGNTTSTITFTYSIITPVIEDGVMTSRGDDSVVLKVNELLFNYNSSNPESPLETGTSIFDANNNEVTEYVIKPTATGTRLEDSRTISIDTSAPLLTEAKVITENDISVLELTFNANINKLDGDIVLEQDFDTYIAPAVISASLYKDIEHNEDAALSSYISTITEKYSVGTNGAKIKDGVAESDLSEKYILDYATQTTDSTVRTALQKLGVLTVTIPVMSTSVECINNKLKIKLTGSYKLPVLGATYTVKLPANLIQSDLGHNNNISEEKTFVMPGVEVPVIRIQNDKEQISETTVTLPLTAKFKIDCQTPGAEIYFNKSEKVFETITYTAEKFNDSNRITNPQVSAEMPSEPTSTSDKYTSEGTLGNDSDHEKGYKYIIRAKAFNSENNTWSETSGYAWANRTVIIVNDTKGNGAIGGITMNYRWMRGGDATNGGVSTPGLPFSWVTSEYDKVRAMKNYGNDWVFVSWNISTKVYPGYLRGDMPNDASTKGPKNWCWASNSWVNAKEYTPVFPGESFTLRTNIDIKDSFDWQTKHMESR